MDLKRLRLFAAAIEERLDSFPVEVTSVKVFFHHESQWLRLGSISSESVALAERQVLERVRGESTGIERPRNSRFVYFWLADRMAVVCLEFGASIKRPAQEKCRKSLLRLNGDADHYFHATHDSLTWLKNRSEFERSLTAVMVDRGRVSEESVPLSLGVANSSIPSPSIYLLALDIDNFKSINDRYGHGYGDLVLACLGWRLETVAKEFHGDNLGRCAIQVFRLGGEEFQILVDGSLKEAEVMEFAERVRAAIGVRALPSEDEYLSLSERDFFDGSELLPESQRTVTVSVGVAMVGVSDLDKSVKISPAMAAIKRQADIALYSAKLGGKDRVRNFSEILGGHGRVADVDSSNGIVSIDIGKEVGVKQGQEFFVFSPKYDGRTDYYLGEGRSRKRVGFYPRLKSARISVFDVQNEVSFCRIEEREPDVSDIQLGSSLEAIPLGSISHIVSKVDYGNSFESREAICAALNEFKGGSLVVAATMRQIERVSDQFGMSKANAFLASIGKEVIATAGRLAKVGQLAVGSIVAVRACQDVEEAGQIASTIFDSVSPDFPQSVEVGVGWLFRSDEGSIKGLLDGARSEDAIDSALLASSINVYAGGGSLHEFDEHTVWHALMLSRVAAQHDRTVADYERFVPISTPMPWTHNQMALSYYYNGDIGKAIEYMKIAMSVEPGFEVIKINFGGILIDARQYELALSVLSSAHLKDGGIDSLLYAKLKVDRGDFEVYVRTQGVGLDVLPARSAWLSSKQMSELREAISAVERP